MKNVDCSVSGDILTIKIDLKADHGPSKSGKTKVVASTGGFAQVPGAPPGFGLNLNVTRK